jgi:hypothetical protein
MGDEAGRGRDGTRPRDRLKQIMRNVGAGSVDHLLLSRRQPGGQHDDGDRDELQ